ncbi:hypothetical protein ACJX0J_008501, partial [Zea mays]
HNNFYILFIMFYLKNRKLEEISFYLQIWFSADTKMIPGIDIDNVEDMNDGSVAVKRPTTFGSDSFFLKEKFEEEVDGDVAVTPETLKHNLAMEYSGLCYILCCHYVRYLMLKEHILIPVALIMY